MKKTLLTLLVIIAVTSVYAQNPKETKGIYRGWYKGAFPEVLGHYTMETDSIKHDSVTVIITKDTVFYDNEAFCLVHTMKAKPKTHYYEIRAERTRIHSLHIFFTLNEEPYWNISLRDFYFDDVSRPSWKGVWKRREVVP